MEKKMETEIERNHSGRKHSIYVPKSLADIINFSESSGEIFGRRVGFMVQAAATIADEECPALPVAVWRALVDANPIGAIQYGFRADDIVYLMFVRLAGNPCRHAIDAQEWGTKIGKMSFAKQYAVFEVVRRLLLRKDASTDFAETVREAGGRVSEE